MINAKTFLFKFMMLPPLVLVLNILVPVPVFAAQPSTSCGNGSDSKTLVLQGAGEVGAPDCSSTGVTNIVSSVIVILSLILGVVAVIVIIFAGFKYVTSSGDAGKISSAKNTLIYALIGIVVAALAQFFVHFALHTTDTALNKTGSALTSQLR
jgi:hypothetical protein